MKVIILTGKFGMGHISASNAIKEYFDMAYGEGTAEIVDLVEYLLPRENEAISKVFNVTAKKLPGIYNFVCRLDAHNASIPMKHWLIKKFDRLIDGYKPDAIISTWPFASKYVGFYKSVTNCEVPLFTCITDISAHNSWLADETTAYFAGSEASREELIEKGVPSDRIFVSGIPVTNAFKKHDNPERSSGKNVLIMGGGLGIIPGIDNMLEIIERNPDIRVTVITGNNSKLEKYLRSKYSNIDVIGFTNQVAEYMRQSDIVITKAGGISMFEAIYANTPILAIRPFLEQERDNAAYIERKQIGQIMDPKSHDFGNYVEDMLQHEAQQRMRNNMRCITESCNAVDIVDVVRRVGKGA